MISKEQFEAHVRAEAEVRMIPGFVYQDDWHEDYHEITIYRDAVGEEEEPSERPCALVIGDGAMPMGEARKMEAELAALRAEVERLRIRLAGEAPKEQQGHVDRQAPQSEEGMKT